MDGALVGVSAEALDMPAMMMTSRAAQRHGLKQVDARFDFIRCFRCL